MTRLVFFRHAETDMAGTFCGQSDPPLNARGHEQIAEMLGGLSAEGFDEIHSSDLHRAVETATSLAQISAAPVITSIALRELHFGDWEGLTWAEIEKLDSVYARRWMDEFPMVPTPNGEPFGAFEKRVLGKVDQLLFLAETKRIAVVTHGGVMRVVLRSRLGYNEERSWEMTRDYCSSFDYASELFLGVSPQ